MNGWRRAVKVAISSLYRWRPRSSREKRVAVLCYHGVAGRNYEDQMAKESFERQMTCLAENYEVVSLNEVFHWLELPADTNQRRPVKVSVTFDDGYQNVLVNALGVLERFRLPSTVFVVPGLSGQIPWWRANAPPEERRLLSKAEIVELSARGVQIGSHTWSHQRLTELSQADAVGELKRSKEWLEEVLQTPICYFAYPFGGYSCSISKWVAESGYRGAFTSQWGRLNVTDVRETPFLLKRVLIEPEDNLGQFRTKVEGSFDWLGFKDCFRWT